MNERNIRNIILDLKCGQSVDPVKLGHLLEFIIDQLDFQKEQNNDVDDRIENIQIEDTSDLNFDVHRAHEKISENKMNITRLENRIKT